MMGDVSAWAAACAAASSLFVGSRSMSIKPSNDEYGQSAFADLAHAIADRFDLGPARS